MDILRVHWDFNILSTSKRSSSNLKYFHLGWKHPPDSICNVHFLFCPNYCAGMSVPRRFWSLPRHVGRRRTLGDLFSTGFGQGGAHAFLSPPLLYWMRVFMRHAYRTVCMFVHAWYVRCMSDPSMWIKSLHANWTVYFCVINKKKYM